MSTATRGFASMSKERRRKEAAKGGKRTNELGKGHKWTNETASMAARKGWQTRKKLLSEKVHRRDELMERVSAYLSEDERAELATLNAELFALIS